MRALLFRVFFSSLCLLFALGIRAEIVLTEAEQAYLEQRPVLKVQNLATFPPFNFYEGGQAKGYSIDYMNLVGELLGVQIEFVSNKPWHEYLQMLKAGELDLIPHIAITEERKAFVDFSSFSHVIYTTGFAVNNAVQIRTAEDLKGKVIAVVNESFLHTFLAQRYPDLKLLLTASTSEAAKAAAIGQADAVVGSLPALNFYIEKDWLSTLKIAPVEDIELPEIKELPMGVAKGNDLLRSILEKAHAEIPPSQISQLKQKWMNQGPQELLDAGLSEEEKSYLADKARLKVCIDPNWMPLEGRVNGRHSGMTADYMAHFQKFIGIPMRFINSSSWSESLKAGESGKCDLFSLIMRTEEREAFLSFSKPYMTIPLVLVTDISQPFISELSILRQKKIGVAEGFAIKPQLQMAFPHLDFVDVKNAEDGMRKVSRGELFGYADALPVTGYLIQDHYFGELKVSGRFEESWQLSLGVDKNQPLLSSIFDKAIRQLALEDHQRIQNRWLAINYQQGIDYGLIWKIAFVFLVVAALLIYRNRSVARLNRKLEVANKAIVARQKMVDRYVLIVTCDPAGHILSANKAFCHELGYQERELLGHHVLKFSHSTLPTEYFQNFWDELTTKQSWSGEAKCANKEGDTVYLSTNVEAILKGSEVVGYRAISKNITDHKRIEELSVTDRLTGLYNRLKVDEILIAQMDRYERHGMTFSALLLDVDNFKSVNDDFGHDIGDKVLIELSQILQQNVRKIDTVGRWGGEEFVVICENTRAEQAATLAEKLRQLIEDTTFSSVGHKTVSIGVSELQPGDTLSGLFKRADQALYAAKHGGRNQVVVNQKQGLVVME